MGFSGSSMTSRASEGCYLVVGISLSASGTSLLPTQPTTRRFVGLLAVFQLLICWECLAAPKLFWSAGLVSLSHRWRYIRTQVSFGPWNAFLWIPSMSQVEDTWFLWVARLGQVQDSSGWCRSEMCCRPKTTGPRCNEGLDRKFLILYEIDGIYHVGHLEDELETGLSH